MSTHWQDLRVSTGQWLGLELTVSRRPRPSWRVEAAPPCMRLIREGRPLLWARRLRTYAQGIQWLLGAEDEPSPLPSLQAREVDSVQEAPLSEPWFGDWARHFARALDASPFSPLHEGTWSLKRVFPFEDSKARQGAPAEASSWERVYAHGVMDYPRQPFAEHVEWGIGWPDQLLGLKHPSRLSPSRLKVWRKRAREGTLPPVLILDVSPLGGTCGQDPRSHRERRIRHPARGQARGGAGPARSPEERCRHGDVGSSEPGRRTGTGTLTPSLSRGRGVIRRRSPVAADGG